MNIEWAKISNRRQKGFTIVELIVVIAVIGVLATITAVGYSVFQNQAKQTASRVTLGQAADKIIEYSAPRNGIYPTTLAEAGLADTAQAGYQYTRTEQPLSFCLTIMTADATLYQRGGGDPQAGICPGHNYSYWNKKRLNETVPLVGGIVDTTTFRTSTASVRYDPVAGTTYRTFVGSPFTGDAGDTYTFSVWVKSDSNWNGGSGNSKIRIANGGTLIKACSIGGVKTNWTQVSCPYTLTSANRSLDVTLGNDGSVGRVWIDDVSAIRYSPNSEESQ